jgi:hypothetical protein
MRRPDRRSSSQSSHRRVGSLSHHPERPAGEQAMSLELWELVQQAISRLERRRGVGPDAARRQPPGRERDGARRRHHQSASDLTRMHGCSRRGGRALPPTATGLQRASNLNGLRRCPRYGGRYGGRARPPTCPSSASGPRRWRPCPSGWRARSCTCARSPSRTAPRRRSRSLVTSDTMAAALSDPGAFVHEVDLAVGRLEAGERDGEPGHDGGHLELRQVVLAKALARGILGRQDHLRLVLERVALARGRVAVLALGRGCDLGRSLPALGGRSRRRGSTRRLRPERSWVRMVSLLST